MEAFEFVRGLPGWFWAGPAVGILAVCVIVALRIRRIRWGRATVVFDSDTSCGTAVQSATSAL